jgi:hypothetical protein
MVKPKDFQSLLKSFVVLNVGEYDLPCRQQPSIKEILTGTTSSGISDQLRDTYTPESSSLENGNHLLCRKSK